MQSTPHNFVILLLSLRRLTSTTLVFLFALGLLSPQRAAAQQTLARFTAGVASSPIRTVAGEADLDGDGVVDVVTAGSNKVFGLGVTAHSGATGKKLWDYKLDGTLVPSTMAIGDVNEDGTPDIILATFRWFRSGDEPDSTILLLSGRSGSLISYFDSGPNEIALGYVLETIDLYDPGQSSLLVTSKVKKNDRSESKITLYTYVEDIIFEECSYNTGMTESISDVHTIPDFDGDGRPDVIFGMADASNGTILNAGAMFIMSSQDCSIADVIRGPTAGLRLGAYFSSLSDWNGDGVEDIGIGSDKLMLFHSGKDFSSLNKAIVPPAGLTLSGPTVLLSDMNADGVPDFGSIAIEPTNSKARRAVFFSGQDSAVIGNFSLTSYAPEEYRWRLSNDLAAFFPRMTTDRNNDGVKDVTFYVRSYYRPYDNPLEDDSPNAEITSISGTCPRDVKIEFLNTPDRATVEAGTRPVFAKATACGLDLPGTLVLKVGGATHQMYDNGENGDEAKGDRIYTAQARLAPGENTLQIEADVTNSGALRAEKSVTVSAVYNYDIQVKKTFEWIEPIGHDRVKSDSLYGFHVKMPFAFGLYGRPFTEMFVSNRGILLPSYSDNTKIGTTPYELETNKRLPSSELLDPAIAVAWGLTTFYNSSALYAKALGSAGNQRFVLTFEGVEFQQDRNVKKSRLDYQIIFHEASGVMSVNYKMIYSSEPTDNQGLSVTMGVQAGSKFGLTFSHKNAVVREPLSIEYVPGQGDGGGNGGGDGGGNGGGTGGDGKGGDNGNGGGTGGQMNATFGLAFSFSQSKTGARLLFDIHSSNAAAAQALTDCKFSVFGGEGSSGTAASYRILGTVSSQNKSKMVLLQRFLQSVQAPRGSGKTRKSVRVFLRAGASCSAAGLNVVSSPVQVKTSKRKGSLTSKRWFAKFAAQLRQ
jgi:hypothetical protein